MQSRVTARTTQEFTARNRLNSNAVLLPEHYQSPTRIVACLHDGLALCAGITVSGRHHA